jgi:putative nucleotidyltransferase with HDIG domain
MTEREFAKSIVCELREAGFQALWAGGCVRDELLGLQPDDYDVATDATPEQVCRLFRRTVTVGMSFGVVEVLGPRHADEQLKVQVATFREDVSYSDGRHPDAVRYASPQDDAQRRDFTINGMFFDPLENRLIDLVGGREDLQARILRAIGSPRVRFAEDKLRMLRAVRFAARFDLSIQDETATAIQDMAPEISSVSAERIAEELRKMLVDRKRVRALELFHDFGLAAIIMEELLPMKGLPQGPPNAPTGDLWGHVLQVMELLGPDPSFTLAMAALLHDVGKPRTQGRKPDQYTFYYHEHVGRRLASEICQRLKLSNSERERIEWLVEKHQFLCNAPGMRPSKLKQTLINPGIRELLALHRADALASKRGVDHVKYCEGLLAEWTEADLNPAPLVTGQDLIARALDPGPRFKLILDKVREAQLDGTIGGREQALEMMDRLIAEDLGA